MPVYFIRAQGTNMVKIGWSNAPGTRLENLQPSHWKPLKFLRVVEGSRKTEKTLHAQFNDQHVRGEWFRFSEVMLTLDLPDVMENAWGTARKILRLPRNMADEIRDYQHREQFASSNEAMISLLELALSLDRTP